MILVKFGGSVITDKQKALTPKRKAIDGLARALKKIDEPVIMVHGGGSFGHYWSVKYDMHTKPDRYDVRGVCIVKDSMVQLDKIILESMIKNRLAPYCLPPTDFMSKGRPVPGKIREIGKIAKKMIPVTFGDALWHGQNKTYILSGDRIMTHLARVLRPRLCIFALNEDGLYADPKSKTLIRRMGGARPEISENSMDVTGGMRRKVTEAAAISKSGTSVFFVNGNKPDRIVKAVKKKQFVGTLFNG